MSFPDKINAQCFPSTNTTATAYNSNNGQRGCMFNILATNTITITCFDANIYAGTTANYEIYYKSGTFVGSETNTGDWTLAGVATGLTSAGNNIPTPLPIPINVTINAGQTYGFYVTNDFGGGMSYTSGVAANTVLASDANFTLSGGVGKSYPFGLTFSFREFNGTVNYVLGGGGALPVELSSFTVLPVQLKTQINWRTETEINNDYFSIERSTDAINWALLTKIEGAGNSNAIKDYEWIDNSPLSGINYYRLSQTDFDGTKEYFDIRAAKFNNSTLEDKLSVFPNPANKLITVNGTIDEIGELEVLDLLGKSLLDKVEVIQNTQGLHLDITSIPEGLFILKVGTQSTRVVKE